jgi:hypothetical protein
MDDYDLLATDIQEKTPKEVKKYYLVSRSGSNSQARICYPLISDYLADMFLLLPEYPRIEQRMHIVNHVKSRFLFASHSFNTSAVLSFSVSRGHLGYHSMIASRTCTCGVWD